MDENEVYDVSSMDSANCMFWISLVVVMFTVFGSDLDRRADQSRALQRATRLIRIRRESEKKV